MMLSWFPIQNDLVPQKFAKILGTIAIMVNTMTRACPVQHPNTRLFTKCNGKTTLSKGLKTHRKDL